MPTTRRDFLRITVAGGAALMIGVDLTGAEEKKPWKPNAWLRIDPDGTVTIIVTKQEMGQGVRTSLAMLVAEELDADWSSVRIEQAEPGPEYQRLNTGGSGSIYSAFTPLRTAGATARAMLVAAAAELWKVDPATLRTEKGFVIGDGRRAGYGELAEAASKREVPKDVPLKTEFRLLGKPLSRLDDPDVITGRARYGLDQHVKGMRYATILRCPTVGGTLVKHDASKAKNVRAIPISTGLALVADSTWAAMKARERVTVEWDHGPHTAFDSNVWLDEAVKLAKENDGVVTRSEGEVVALTPGAMTFEATYVYPFYAHAAIEPLSATVHVHDGQCEMWIATQAPNSVQNDVARALGIDAAKVIVHPALIGGGFGRRLRTDYAVEAAELGRALGEPVQVVWTREDDLRDGRLQHGTAEGMRGAIGPNGRIAGWQHKKVCNPFMTGSTPGAQQLANLGTYYRGISWGVYDVPYDIPAIETRYVRHDSPVRYGPWRAVFSPSATFARESFFDELAHAAKKDPLQFRLDHLGGAETVKAGDLTIERARLRRVLEAVRDRSGWGKPLGGKRGRGVACNVYDGDTHIAYVAEVTVDGEEWSVDRIVAAVDCGPIVNPIGVEQQVEGGIVWALGQLLHQITIKEGRVEQGNYHDYPIPTIAQMPKIEIHHLPTMTARPSGMGEGPVSPLVPAVTNAMFAVTGKRVRRLPL
ncbi:MAG TPA: molybdopterin cofactor-binding domain-containing protein [Thermoanaerobaculia bacterium]